MYVYILSPKGKLDTTPCKIGISEHPLRRIEELKRTYEQATADHEFAAIYEVNNRRVAEAVEREVLEQLSTSLYSSRDFEWVEVSAREIMSYLNPDERTRLYLGDGANLGVHRVQARIPTVLYNQFRAKLDQEGRSINWVMRRVVERYVKEDGAGWLL